MIEWTAVVLIAGRRIKEHHTLEVLPLVKSSLPAKIRCKTFPSPTSFLSGWDLTMKAHSKVESTTCSPVEQFLMPPKGILASFSCNVNQDL